MKIEFIKSACGVGYAYFAGDVVELPNAQAEELIEMGYAISIEEQEEEKKSKKK